MYTRRELGKLALAALPAAHVLRDTALFGQAKPNSRVRGVLIGMNVPYNFGGRSAPIDEIIQKCVQLGVSGVELRTQPVEAYLGLPESLVTAAAPAGGRNAKPPTPEQLAARKTAADDIRKWRLSAPMAKVREVKQKFDDAGISIEIVKVDNIFSMRTTSSTRFTLAKALGRWRVPPRSHIDRRRRLRSPSRKAPRRFRRQAQLIVAIRPRGAGPKEWKEV